MGTKARPAQLRPHAAVQQWQAGQARRVSRPRFKPKDWPDRPRPSADDLTPELRTLVTRANAAMSDARRARRVARDNGDTDEADRQHARIRELSDLVHIVMRDHAAGGYPGCSYAVGAPPA